MKSERTMEFILERPAAISAKLGAMADRAGCDRGLAEEEREASRGYRRPPEASAKLIHSGMKILARTEDRLDKLTATVEQISAKVEDLAEAQKKTEQALNRFIDSMRHALNGRKSNGQKR
jgi:methyl-accepting chemotaxis protein